MNVNLNEVKDLLMEIDKAFDETPDIDKVFDGLMVESYRMYLNKAIELIKEMEKEGMDIHQYIYDLSEIIIGVSKMEDIEDTDKDTILRLLSDTIHVMNKYP